MGLSHRVDISGSDARTPWHISSFWTSGVGATCQLGQMGGHRCQQRWTTPDRWPGNSQAARQPGGSTSWHKSERQVSPYSVLSCVCVRACAYISNLSTTSPNRKSCFIRDNIKLNFGLTNRNPRFNQETSVLEAPKRRTVL